MKTAQKRYKRNYDKRLRCASEEINPDDNVFLRVERKYEKETRHKLALISERPFQVKDTDRAAKTALIERPDKSVEHISRSRVVLAHRGSINEIRTAIRPSTTTETVSDFPIDKDVNQRQLTKNIQNNKVPKRNEPSLNDSSYEYGTTKENSDSITEKEPAVTDAQYEEREAGEETGPKDRPA